MNAAEKLIEAFALKMKASGVLMTEEDNGLRLLSLEEKLPKRLPRSFEALLSQYSFPAFDLGGISLFGWESELNDYTAEASASKGSLSEVLIPAGYVQIGRPDTGSFDAVCFKMNQKTNNREYPIVQVDHEEILLNWRVKISQELYPSFRKLAERVLSTERVTVWPVQE